MTGNRFDAVETQIFSQFMKKPNHLGSFLIDQQKWFDAEKIFSGNGRFEYILDIQASERHRVSRPAALRPENPRVHESLRALVPHQHVQQSQKSEEWSLRGACVEGVIVMEEYLEFAIERARAVAKAALLYEDADLHNTVVSCPGLQVALDNARAKGSALGVDRSDARNSPHSQRERALRRPLGNNRSQNGGKRVLLDRGTAAETKIVDALWSVLLEHEKLLNEFFSAESASNAERPRLCQFMAIDLEAPRTWARPSKISNGPKTPTPSCSQSLRPPVLSTHIWIPAAGLRPAARHRVRRVDRETARGAGQVGQREAV